MVQVAIYCRVSTDDQSCDRQERDLTNYCDRLEYLVVGIYKEIASGSKDDRPVRKQLLKLAQARKIDAIVVTELSRWGRSTIDLISTLQDLQSRGVSLIAQTGLQLDLSTPQGKLMATLLSGIAEFERDTIRERVKSGIAAAKARGKKIGRQKGDNVKADKMEARVIGLVMAGRSYRRIANELKLSKTTVLKIVKAWRARVEPEDAA